MAIENDADFEEVPETRELSLREEIEAASKPVDDVEVKVETKAEKTDVDDKQLKNGRDRDEHGRFKAVDKEPVKTEPLKADPVKTDIKAEVKIEVKPALAPPIGWTAEAKNRWAKLEPEVQQAVLQREQDVHKQISKHDEERNFGRSIQRTLQPYLAQIQAEGGTPETAIRSLLNTAYLLRTGSADQKRALILQTARQFGVDLGSDPGRKETGSLPEFNALQQRINQLEGTITSRERAQKEQLQSEIQQEITAFSTDPENRYYNEVKGHMAALLRDGASTDLKDAYDQSCWARPDIRTTLLAQKEAEQEQKRRDETRVKAEEARRRKVSITGGRGATVSSAQDNLSLRDEIRANMAASDGAV